jgi:hypothetical protein
MAHWSRQFLSGPGHADLHRGPGEHPETTVEYIPSIALADWGQAIDISPDMSLINKDVLLLATASVNRCHRVLGGSYLRRGKRSGLSRPGDRDPTRPPSQFRFLAFRAIIFEIIDMHGCRTSQATACALATPPRSIDALRPSCGSAKSKYRRINDISKIFFYRS